ncbi:MAG: glycoside hydrolase [Lentisphaeria bacterium]|nr:glycoside hydrolase [Lentisphaeria bacterium]
MKMSHSQCRVFLDKARALTPQLKQWEVPADFEVAPVHDPRVWQDYRLDAVGPASALAERDLGTGESFLVRLPETVVGQLAFSLISPGGYADSPSRLRITLGELPQEVVFPDKPYRGTLNGSWLQTEIVNIDDLPAEVVLPRRYSCRYIRFDLLGVPQKVRFSDIRILARGAEAELPPPPAELPEELRAIDRASVRTLRNCMQTCFEDGPKRDRRLWLGDLRLQAMVNKVSYRRFDLVARSLYLLAGCPRPDGEVCGCVMEHPAPRPGCHAHDFAMLFPVTLEEHCRWSGDYAIGEELFSVAETQLALMERFFRNDIFVGINDPYLNWFFVDHDLDLDRQVAVHCIMVCGWNALATLARKLGRTAVADAAAARSAVLTAAARKRFVNARTGVAESGPDRQISMASQIWMVQSGAFSPEEGRRALTVAERTPGVLRPSSPYMFHYLLDSWRKCGDEDRMLELLKEYYGGMIRNGADTFWEVYRPNEPFFSPYRDVRMNSACHAWSGTAAYFLRKGYL